jgi:hypothetical protein
MYVYSHFNTDIQGLDIRSMSQTERFFVEKEGNVIGSGQPTL